jgi:hypothetical protein
MAIWQHLGLEAGSEAGIEDKERLSADKGLPPAGA